MKRSIAIAALSISIGLPAVSIGAAVVQCGSASAAYEKFSKKIHQVAHLDHKPSPATIRQWTKYNLEVLARLSKQMEIMCSQADSQIESSSIFVPNPHSLMLSGEVGDNPYYVGEKVDVLPAYAAGPISQVPYPDYPSLSRPISDSGDTGFYAPGGYFGGGGWYGAPGGNPGSSNPPVTPIQPTPEPSTFALLAIGIAAGIWKVSRA